jgi:uncharacterized protein (TIRG00374 family)
MSGRSQGNVWGKRVGKLVLVLVSIPLLWWTFRQVPFSQVWITLRQVAGAQVGLWLIFNAGLVILMTGRWWMILRALGYRLPYLALTEYRLAAFAVSYFTPGPQFGGEPVQVLALRQRHQVPGTTGTASVGLERLLDLIANFSFLVIGMVLALVGTQLPGFGRTPGVIFAVGLLVIPLGYLILMLGGQRPLGAMIGRLPTRLCQNRFVLMLQEVESEMSYFCLAYPTTVLAASLVSLCSWAGMVFEFWLLARILGLDLSLIQAVSALVAARMAFLAPLPGGLGVLEASQVMAMQTLGVDPSYGISISLLIRLRDVLFGVGGLLVVLWIARGRRLPDVRNH